MSREDWGPGEKGELAGLVIGEPGAGQRQAAKSPESG